MAPRRRSSTLTDPQIKVLKVIEDYQNTNGFPPSIRDIQDMGKFSSTSVVNYYLDQLETMGHIKGFDWYTHFPRFRKQLIERSKTYANQCNRFYVYR
jgi:SOS-response transcriptional repressor LexA